MKSAKSLVWFQFVGILTNSWLVNGIKFKIEILPIEFLYLCHYLNTPHGKSIGPHNCALKKDKIFTLDNIDQDNNLFAYWKNHL